MSVRRSGILQTIRSLLQPQLQTATGHSVQRSSMPGGTATAPPGQETVISGGASGGGGGPVGRRLLSILIWGAISVLGAGAFAFLALYRGETINAVWIVVAAFCTYAVAYRFYSKFLALKVFELDDDRATPAERLENGVDYVPTNRWVLFGHHFAAIAGAGPLVGPVLAA